MNRELMEAYVAERININRMRLQRSQDLSTGSVLSYTGAMYELEALRRFLDSLSEEE